VNDIDEISRISFTCIEYVARYNCLLREWMVRTPDINQVFNGFWVYVGFPLALGSWRVYLSALSSCFAWLYRAKKYYEFSSRLLLDALRFAKNCLGVDHAV